MNRLVLIGNGFDLAHGLKTSYADFIEWYWEYRVQKFWGNLNYISEDPLCKLEMVNHFYCWNVFVSNLPHVFKKIPGKEVIQSIINTPSDYKVSYSPFFEKIIKDVEKKGWVDIEDIYYSFLKSSEDPKQINDNLEFVKEKLIECLNSIEKPSINPIIRRQILEPISQEDIAIGSMDKWEKMLKERLDYHSTEWQNFVADYRTDKENSPYSITAIEDFKERFGQLILSGDYDEVYFESCPTYLLPDNIILLNFNYTSTADMYLTQSDRFTVNHIHGKLSNPESVIFGYGDERDEKYETLMKKNDNEYLRHIKSFRYLDASNYRKMLAFIESDSFQVCTMGHSCGVTDRTLLSTLFEHKNCVSIKPFYYKKDDGTDNYRDLIQNIARNMSDPHLMRDRVVRKDRCRPLGKE
ncbi:MAG: bacteriophage abortive infection AbiH family protein [Bacteroidales bacterium]|nr:bacteriophage abortive infection AbiH family protein [Bacteroidales bacterium]